MKLYKQKPHLLYPIDATTAYLVCYECNSEWTTYVIANVYKCPTCNTTSRPDIQPE